MFKVKGNIRDVHRVEDSYVDRSTLIRLDKNERSIPFKEKDLKVLKEYINSLTICGYPQPDPLYKKLATYLNVDRENLYITTGSDLAIKTVFETFINDGDSILMHSPSYAMYSIYADIFGVKKIEVPFANNLSFDLYDFIDKINDKISMVVLENPNGFVGVEFLEKDIITLIKKAQKTQTLVIIDEAYFHFCRTSVINYVQDFDNLIIIRTFSKAFSMAGVRLGYIVANNELVSMLTKVKPMHEVTGLAIAIGEYMLEKIDIMENYVKMIEDSKEYIARRAKEKGYEVFLAHTNFFLLKLTEGMQSQYFKDEMYKRNILVRRPFTQDFLKGWVRITIGNKEQMQCFIEAVGDVLL